MKALKIIGIIILNFLLFIALPIFSLAFWINSTALSPSFIASEIKRLDFTLLVEDALHNEQGLSQEFNAAFISYMKKLEPQIESQVDVVVHSTYDYLLGKKENPELTKTLRRTFFSPDFITYAIDSIDIAPIASEAIKAQIEQQIPLELSWIEDYLDHNLKNILLVLEPSIKEQLKKSADPIADYLVGTSRSFTVVIQTMPLIEELRQDLLQYVLTSPPPELAGLPQSVIKANFDAAFDQLLVPAIPSSFEINETMIGADIPDQISRSIDAAEKGLMQVRPFVRYFQLGFWLLIAFMFFLIAGIILIYRQVKPITLNLGILFIIFGVFELASFLVAKNVVTQQLSQISDIPTAIQLWLPQSFAHFIAPMITIGIGFAATGLVLIVTSIVYKPRETDI